MLLMAYKFLIHTRHKAILLLSNFTSHISLPNSMNVTMTVRIMPFVWAIFAKYGTHS